jgi:hypothetical protein
MERNPESAPDSLSGLHSENHVIIRMLVTPSVVFPLLDNFRSGELTILTVLLSQVDTVGMILLGVPHMIVFAFPIIISPVAMIVIGPQRQRSNQGGAQQ